MALAEKYWIDGLPEPGLEGNLPEVYWFEGLPEDLIEAAPPPASSAKMKTTLSVLGTRAGSRQIMST